MARLEITRVQVDEQALTVYGLAGLQAIAGVQVLGCSTPSHVAGGYRRGRSWLHPRWPGGHPVSASRSYGRGGDRSYCGFKEEQNNLRHNRLPAPVLRAISELLDRQGQM